MSVGRPRFWVQLSGERGVHVRNPIAKRIALCGVMLDAFHAKRLEGVPCRECHEKISQISNAEAVERITQDPFFVQWKEHGAAAFWSRPPGFQPNRMLKPIPSSRMETLSVGCMCGMVWVQAFPADANVRTTLAEAQCFSCGRKGLTRRSLPLDPTG